MKLIAKVSFLIFVFSYGTILSQTNFSVYVQQIGYYNTIDTTIYADNGLVNISQIGSKNKILIETSAGTINKNIIQKGYNNTFIDLSLTANATRQDITVFQKGKYQNLILYGGNSISERMIVSMRGKKKTVIIRNFKR